MENLEKTGQQPGSPPGDQPGQEQDSPTGTAAKDKGGTAASPDKGEKPLPYDQDPKWKAARAAQASLNEILEAHGFESIEDLRASVKEGVTLKRLIGNKDAKQLLEDSSTLAQYKEYWAQKEAERLEEKETPEETIARLKKEIKGRDAASQKAKEDQASREADKQAVETYNSEIGKIVKAAELSKPVAELLTLYLGVENPMVAIDIADNTAVKTTATEEIKRFSQLVTAIKQEAVNDYAAGKSNLKPIAAASGGDKGSSGEEGGDKAGKEGGKPAGKKKSLDEMFDDAASALTEMIEQTG